MAKKQPNILTAGDLENISNIIDNKLEAKFNEKLAPFATKEFVRDQITASHNSLISRVDKMEARLLENTNEGVQAVLDGVDEMFGSRARIPRIPHR